MNELQITLNGTKGDFTLDIDLTLPAKGVSAIFGPSGCGKTTILRCVAGLERMQSGIIKISKESWQDGNLFTPPHKRDVGYVFQEASLFPHLSVRSNLAYGLNRAKTNRKLPSLKSVEALLGLKPLIDRSPEKLSGGERQRVAIGRAIMSGPKILLMDEPLSGLDTANKNEILPYLERVANFLEIPVLYVSHDIAEIERLAEHITFLESGQITSSGPIAKLAINPEAPFAKMARPFAILNAEVIDRDANFGITTFSAGGHKIMSPHQDTPIGTSCKMRVYANDIALASKRPTERTSFLNILDARISEAHASDEYRLNVYLRLGSDGTGPCLVTRITKKAWKEMGLDTGAQIFALIKRAEIIANK